MSISTTVPGYIYKITNIITTKVYIGKTQLKGGIQQRFKGHKACARSSNEKTKKACPKLYNSIRKYGEEVFTVELLTECEVEDLNFMEILFILFYDSTNKDKGYNVTKGGDGVGSDISEEIRKRMSKGHSLDKELGIAPYYKDSKHIGYFSHRRVNGEERKKYFTKQKYSIIQNYMRAKIWFEQVKNKEPEQNNIYNKDIDLPRNITLSKNRRNVIVGFHYIFDKDKDMTNISFITNTLSMKEKLEKILKEKEYCYNDYELKIEDSEHNFEIGNSKYNIMVKDSIHTVTIQGEDALKINDRKRDYIREYNLPENLNLDKNTKNDIIGFRFCLTIDGIDDYKAFGLLGNTISENLKLTLDYKEFSFKRNNKVIKDSEYEFELNGILYIVIAKDGKHKISFSGIEVRQNTRGKLNDLPSHIVLNKNRQGIIAGFRIWMRTPKIDTGYTDSKITMKDKLEKILVLRYNHYTKNNIKIEDKTYVFTIFNIEYTVNIVNGKHTIVTNTV